LLEEVSNADVVVFGSPIFFFDITGELRSFLERLFYPYVAFKRGGARIISPKRIRTAFLYTMNVTEQEMKYSEYEQNLAATHSWTKYIFGYDPEIIYAYNTYQYKNYDSYVADLWNISDKKKWHDEMFPKACKNAYELGKKLTKN
jgi:multimeric flavodoxin WrbA